MFQSTLPNGERLGFFDCNLVEKVSIHAPERGATLITNGLITVRSVSIHAPERGAT